MLMLIVILPAFCLQAAEYALFGDAAYPRPALTDLRLSIEKEKIKSLVLLGDQIYDPAKTYDEIWLPFKQSGFEYSAVAIGNHKHNYPEEIEYFGLPGEYYTRDFKDEIFIVLNSDNTTNVFAQMRFLYAELKKYKDTPKHIFLVFHHPLDTISEFHDWGERWLFHLGFRVVMWSFQEKITAVLVGHNHFSGFYTVKDIPMVLAGGGVEQRNGQYDLNANIKREFVDDKNSLWVKMVTDNQKVTFDYIDVKTQQSRFHREIQKK